MVIVMGVRWIPRSIRISHHPSDGAIPTAVAHHLRYLTDSMCIHRFIHPFNHLIYSSFHPPIHLIYSSIQPSIHSFIHPSIHLFINPSFHSSIYPPIFSSIYSSMVLICIFYVNHRFSSWKRTNSVSFRSHCVCESIELCM